AMRRTNVAMRLIQRNPPAPRTEPAIEAMTAPPRFIAELDAPCSVTFARAGTEQVSSAEPPMRNIDQPTPSRDRAVLSRSIEDSGARASMTPRAIVRVKMPAPTAMTIPGQIGRAHV